MPIHAQAMSGVPHGATRAGLAQAGRFGNTDGRRRAMGGSARVLVIDCVGSADGPSLLARTACDVLEQEGQQARLLSLDGRAPSATGMLRQWLAAHGIVICTPACGAQPPFELARTIDRLACSAALSIEPGQLADRVYGIVVQGEGPLADGTRRALSLRLDRMGMVDGDSFARLDRHAGYFEMPGMLAAGEADFIEQVGNVARAVSAGVREMRAGRVPKAPPRFCAGS